MYICTCMMTGYLCVHVYVFICVHMRDMPGSRVTLQHSATYCYTLQHAATRCNTLQRTATHCNTMQHGRRRDFRVVIQKLQHTATYYNTLQHTTTHCNTLQHTMTHCNTLQHAATHCNTRQHTLPDPYTPGPQSNTISITLMNRITNMDELNESHHVYG